MNMNDETNTSNHDVESNSSNNPLLTFFSSLIFSFRSQTSVKSSYGKQPRQSQSKYYKVQQNSFLKHERINLLSQNDENNNQKILTELDENSVTIDLPFSSSDEPNEKYIFTTEHFFWIFFITILYFTWFIFIAGISIIHLIIYLVIITLYVISDQTRRFALAILIYLTYLLLYDALHVVPNYTISKVHIEDVYLIEKRLFGIIKNEQLMTLNEYFRLNHIPFLDVFTGICYLNW